MVSSRPESNMLKILLKILSGIPQKFLSVMVFSVPILHYAPRLATFLAIVLKQ